MLRDANIRKSDGFAVNQIFQILILIVFQGKNLFRFLDSSQGLDLPSENTYYRFLNHSKYAWRRFLLSLSLRIITTFEPLTNKKRIKVFNVDDSTQELVVRKLNSLLGYLIIPQEKW